MRRNAPSRVRSADTYRWRTPRNRSARLPMNQQAKRTPAGPATTKARLCEGHPLALRRKERRRSSKAMRATRKRHSAQACVKSSGREDSWSAA